MAIHIRRREFIVTLSGAAAWPLVARAQRPTTIQKVGFLSDEDALADFEVITNALSELGYVEGRNIVFERRNADGKNDLLPHLAADLVSTGVNVIVAVGTPATRAAKNATNSIPIVFSRISDPIALGLVTSLARPGGNLTGVTVLTRDLAAKRLEMLAEVVQRIKRVGVLSDPTFPPTSLELEETKRAASLLNIELELLSLQRAEELEAAVYTLVERRGQALIIVPTPLFTAHRKRLAEIAITNRLPTMLYRREMVEAGGLHVVRTALLRHVPASRPLCG